MDQPNELWLSPISVWEALVLHRNGRVTLHGNLADWLSEGTANIHEAPLTHEIALVAASLLLHGGPADRFIAATAKVLGLTLVRADHRLLGLGEIALWLIADPPHPYPPALRSLFWHLYS